MRKVLLSLAVFFSAVSIQAQDVTVDVNVQENNSPISPYIYGSNNISNSATAARWGGNRTSAYNWENNYSNAGADYLDQSDKFFLTGIATADQSTPAIPVLNFVKTTESKQQYSLVTIQAAGYVAADANGVVDISEAAPSPRWNEVVFRKGSELSLTPDKTDGYVYMDEYVNYLIQTLGSAGNGGPDAYSIDNEPVLWDETHSLIRPNELTFDELFEKTYQVGSLVKDLDPNADVYGPVFYGWQGMERLNSYTLFKPIKDANGYDFFMDYYLDSLRKIEEVEGRRIVDVLDMHWYPEAKSITSGLRIVDLFGNYTEEDMITTGMIAARLQAPRSLWDETYVENSFIASQYLKVNLINRMKQSINTYYPGTKLAFTEFKYGAEYHFSGGLAIADVLGIFGREGVYMAGKWDPINSYTTSAYDLYTNYNGEGGAFGTTSVKAIVDNNNIMSSFASVDEQGNLHLIFINKDKVDKVTQVNLAGGYYSEGVVYGFGQDSQEIISYDAVSAITNNAFTYTVPAYTALHFILAPVSRTELISAKVIEGSANKIELTFSADVTLDETQTLTEITATSGINDLSITAIAKGNANQIICTLSAELTSVDTILSVIFNGIGITDVNSIPVANFSSAVKNEMLSAPAYLQAAQTDEYGKYIELTFSKPIDVATTSAPGINVLVNNNSVVINSFMFDALMPYTLKVFLEERLLKYDTITVSHSISGLAATDATLVSDFSVTVLNLAPNYSPIVDSVILKDNYSLSVYFNKDVIIEDLLQTGFVFKENGTEIPVTFALTKNELRVSSETPMLQENTYTMDYIDNGNVQSLHGGYLDAIVDYAITNSLTVTPSAIELPARIEAEGYSYIKGAIQLETTSDVDGDVHIGFIGNDYLFAYNVNCTNAQTYTLSLRHAGLNNGFVEVWVNGVKKTDIYVPESGSWNTWMNSAAAFDLEQGEQFIELRVKTSGFNLNWLSIEEGSNPSEALISSAFTSSAGTDIFVFYDREIQELPDLSLITIKVDGEKIPLKTVDFYKDDLVKFVFTTDSIIMKGQEVTISYSGLTILSTQGGLLSDVEDYSIQNKSRVANTKIIVPASDLISVYPIPAKVGNGITLKSQIQEELIYSIIATNGAIVESGVINNINEITINNAGVYTLQIQSNLSKAILTIVVE